MKMIRELIRQGKTEEAIEQLQNMAGAAHEDACTHLSSRYQHLTSENIKGKLDYNDFIRELQKINDDILQLAKTVERHSPDSAPRKHHSLTRRSIYFWLGAVAIVAFAGIAFYLSSNTEKDIRFFRFESYKAPAAIVHVLDSLRNVSENVQDISVDMNYYWVILLGRDRALWSRDIPPFLDEKLRELYQQNQHIIKQVSLGPASRWAILVDESDYWVYPDVQDTLRKYLNDVSWRNSGALKQVAFGPRPDEFVVLAAPDFFAYSNVPPELTEALRTNPLEVKSVAIGPENEWVILSGKHDAATSASLDSRLKDTLNKMKKAGREIRKVCLLKNNGWIVLTD